jgi:hypothetical protein
MRNSNPKLPIKTVFTDHPKVVGVYIETQMGPYLTPILIFGVIIWHILFFHCNTGGRGVDAWCLPHLHPIPAAIIAYTVPLLNSVPCFLAVKSNGVVEL